MEIRQLAYKPFKLKRNRVRRPFQGGYLLEHWQGIKAPEDGYSPEAWIASMVAAVNPEPIESEGLSEIIVEYDTKLFLKDLIESSPDEFLGKEHCKKYGKNMGVLVKMLDSYSRLLIQVHPDKCFAKEAFQADFGKTEAWYILGGRKINGEDPYVFLGFKPGITREKWVELFHKQDILAMENALHKIPAKPGDVFFVEGGVPHAAGSGLFFMEIQEPTDFTIRTERRNLEGKPLTDSQLHQGLGFERMFDCFHYEGYTREKILEKCLLKPEILREETGGRDISLISYRHTPMFAVKKLEIEKKMPLRGLDTFSVLLILQGEGKLYWRGGEMEVVQGDEVFVPACIGEITGEKKATTRQLTVIQCLPPKA